MNRGKLFPKPVIPFWSANFLILLSFPFLSFFGKTDSPNSEPSEPPSLVCIDPEPVTRWNKLTDAQRIALDDTDPTTNVTGFHSGFCNGGGVPITVDISVTGAPNSNNPTTINNRFANRWGVTSFSNGRESAGASGTKYCFTFSEALPMEVSSQEHRFFHDGEHVRVTAFDGATPVNVDGNLAGPANPATVTGSGTPEVHFDANGHRGVGVYWQANTGGDPVTQICVEYYHEGTGQSIGREPFTLNICNADRCLFDDPFAVVDADNPDPTAPAGLIDQLEMTMDTWCVRPAASNAAGNVDVTFRMQLTNNGTENITQLQIENDLADHIPASALIALRDADFGPANSMTVNPTFDLGFNGENTIQIFDGTSGTLAPGETMEIDIVAELNPNQLAQYEQITNQSFAFGREPGGSQVSVTSDAPLGAPGNTGGQAEGLLLYLPALNISAQPLDYDRVLNCASNGDVEITLEATIENTGNTELDMLTLEADLTSQLGSAFVNIASGPTITASTATTDPTLNSSFDGSGTNAQIFDGASGLLEQGQRITVQVRLRVDPNALAAPNPLTAQFYGTARGLADNVKPLPGCDAGELIAFDFSDGGTSPESPNTGFLGNTGGHDDPLPMLLANVGLAKRVLNYVPAASGVPGNVDVRFRVEMENTGNVNLSSLGLTDPLAGQLGNAYIGIILPPQLVASTATTEPTLGVFPNNIFNGSTGLLESNQTISVEFTAEMNPDAASSYPLVSVAKGGGDGQGINGNPTTLIQIADSGSDTEGTNPGEPGDQGCMTDALVLNLPGLMVAQEVVGVDYATSGTPGHFDVIVEVVVQNTGSVNLTDFSLVENLAAANQLGSTFVSVTGTPQIVPVGAHGTLANANTAPNPNPGYAGNNDLLAGGGLVEPGQVFVLRYRIEVNPEAGGAPAFPKLQAQGFATGDGPAGVPIQVSDFSDSGFSAQSTNFGRPGNTGGSNDPTPLGNCGTQIGALSCNNSVQVSMNQACIAAITPSMVLEGEIPQCADDDLLPLGAYYEILMVTNDFGQVIPDAVPATPNIFEIDGSYVGQTLTVKVSDVVNSNNCWGTLTLEDKLGPVFDCPSPVYADCFVDLTNFPAPGVADNCDPNPTVNFVGQQIIDNDICDDGIYRVRRTYSAVDQYGNQSPNPCVFEIHLTRPDVEFPSDIVWHCDQYGTYPNIVDPTALNPAVTDTDGPDHDIDVSSSLAANILANTGSGTVNNTGGACGYAVTSSDGITTSCGNTFQITRTWVVVDWCTGNVITTGANGNDNVQIIKVIDEVAPTISMSDFEVNATIPAVGFLPCRSQGILPPPDVYSDNCQSNDDVEVAIITPIGEAIYIGDDGSLGGMIPAPGLEMGSHLIVYQATDACGNTSSVTVTVTVVDELTPTAVCDELTEASLGSNGLATVFATTFDDGSTDNCCIDYFEVRRMDDPCDDGEDDTIFGPSVNFCCEDIANSPVMVVFRVHDCHGNFNDCMVEVEVSDKQNPVMLNYPVNERMDCETYAADFQTQLDNLAGNAAAQNELFDAQFGTANFSDNCGFTISKDITVNIDQCLEGSITRTWSATDNEGLNSQTCSQTIFVDHISDWVVEFAPDLTIECGQTVPEFVEPEIFFESCEMIGVSYEDATITVVPDACFKIERTWIIINWCVLGALTDQEIVEMPESQLGLPFPDCDLDGDGDCDDRTFRDSWDAFDMPDATQLTQTLDPDTDPDSDPWDGYIAYVQTIKAIDSIDPVFTSGCDILPDVCVENANCTADVTLPMPTVMDCSPMVTIAAASDFGTGFGPFTDIAPGTYPVTFFAVDGCNNNASCSTTITVKDCKKPTPYCKPGLVVDIMATLPPMVPVSANQLNDNSTDNCPGDLIFSFSSDVTFTDTTFFCHNQGDNPVQIWVTDAAGNQDFCETTITVQANLGQCSDDLVVDLGGVIDTENGQPVQGVDVTLSGQNSGSQMTPLSGDFQFEGILQGNDVTVAPSLDEEPLNGVTTFDLVLIGKHILGVQSLDSPYKLIAADANNSGSVTTFDMVELRKLILHINQELPNNTSWRFVPSDYQFPDPSDPWAEMFPEVINVNNIPSDVLDADFIAIKIGDVNGSVSPSLDQGTGDRSFEGTFLLAGQDHQIGKGETFTLELGTDDMEVVGFQFTLEFDPSSIEFLSVENALTEPRNFGQNYVEGGYLTVSWNGEMTREEPVISLRFRAMDNVNLAETLNMSNQLTPAEAYSTSGEMLDVALEFGSLPASGHFELYQNVPNPFSNFTVISFHLPKASQATLTISDVSGRIVRTVTSLYKAGYNEIQLPKDALPKAGVFYYNLETPTDTDTKTMVLID